MWQEYLEHIGQLLNLAEIDVSQADTIMELGTLLTEAHEERIIFPTL